MATTEVTTTSALTSATSTTIVATRRAVRLRGVRTSAAVAGGLGDVPGATHGVDHRLPAGVDLLAEVGDVELDDVGLPTEVVVPDTIEDLRLAEDAARVAHQVPQQLELGRRQADVLA